VNEVQIPTGEIKSVFDTPFDLSQATLLNDIIPLVDGGGERGLDHTFVLTSTNPSTTLSTSDATELPYMATLSHPSSGRQLVVYGTQPGIQVYTANFLQGSPPFTQHNAICLETQHFPDAINQPTFPSILLESGDVYKQEALFCLRLI
jgi:aldose 1-epimerase